MFALASRALPVRPLLSTITLPHTHTRTRTCIHKGNFSSLLVATRPSLVRQPDLLNGVLLGAVAIAKLDASRVLTLPATLSAECA